MNENNLLTKEEFGAEMAERIARSLGENYKVKLQNVRKNNDVNMLGIMVTEIKKNISPTIYMDCFYERYLDGKTLDGIEEEVLTALRKGMPSADFDMGFFTDYQMVKQKICYRLINAEKNKKLLEDIPFIPFLDLAICFYYPVDDEKIGKGSIMLRNTHMELWGVDTQELWRAAQHNTKTIYPPECFSMERLMLEMVGGCLWNEPSGELPESNGIPMHVITNQERVFGASVILYDQYLDRIAQRLGGGFYLLPSSIHEFIIMPKLGEGEGARLREIVEEVNQKGVEKQDVLSDNLYYYNEQEKKICMMNTCDMDF